MKSLQMTRIVHEFIILVGRYLTLTSCFCPMLDFKQCVKKILCIVFVSYCYMFASLIICRNNVFRCSTYYMCTFFLYCDYFINSYSHISRYRYNRDPTGNIQTKLATSLSCGSCSAKWNFRLKAFLFRLGC